MLVSCTVAIAFEVRVKRDPKGTAVSHKDWMVFAWILKLMSELKVCNKNVSTSYFFSHIKLLTSAARKHAQETHRPKKTPTLNKILRIAEIPQQWLEQKKLRLICEMCKLPHQQQQSKQPQTRHGHSGLSGSSM